MKKKGTLIVLDGTDGSGKSTQFNLLIERMAAEGIPFAQIKFPCYDSPASVLVKQYLAGEYGADADGVNVYAASMFYAMDRYDAWAKDYNNWRTVYENGGIVIADRYTTANLIHQGGKLKTLEDRLRFFSWLTKTEFDLFGLPKPDQVILLDMPASKAMGLLEARQRETGEAADIHEKDVELLRRCEEAALDAAYTLDWYVVPCAAAMNAGIRSAKQIHESVWRAVKEVLPNAK